MRRKNCKRLLAGMLCVLMIFMNGTVTGSSVHASEIGLMGNELSEENTELGNETPTEEKEEERGSGEAEGSEEVGNKEEGSIGEDDGSGDESGEGDTEASDDNIDDEKEENTVESETETSEGEDDEDTDEETVKPEYAQTASEGVIASGVIDEEYGHISWMIDANGKLTVEGTGDCRDYTKNTSAPWYKYRDTILTAEISVSGMKSAKRMFRGCGNLISIKLNNFNTSNVTDMSYMFYGCANLSSLDVSNFNTSNVTDMNNMFYGCANLSSLDISNFDTGNVTDMNDMFHGCASLISLDISNFNTSKVTDMSDMFYGCESLAKLNVSSFDTRSVTNMRYMFFECKNLVSLDVSNFDTSNVTDMECMFAMVNLLSTPRESNLIEISLSGFDTGNVTDMDGMFSGCCKIRSLDLKNFNTGKVTSMRRMFFDCSALTDLNIESFDTGNVTDMEQMFGWCYALSSLNVSNFNTENVLDMGGMFDGCRSIFSLDVSGFKTENVISMFGMFDDCENLKELNLDGFNTKNVTDMGYMFSRCYDLVNLDLSNFDTSSVINMECMFAMNNSYESSSLSDLDLSNFDTSNVTDMQHMFQNCEKLLNLDLSSFQTGNITEMQYMFDGCNSLQTLDISNFNTENVTNMYSMFKECTSLRTLGISNFNTKNVTDMRSMFYKCSNLESLDVRNFNTEKVYSMEAMFSGCSSLRSLDLSSFNIGNVTNISQIFNDCNSLVTLDISSFDMGHINQESLKRFRIYSCENLKTIYSPYNLFIEIDLPAGTWYRSDGSTVTELPQNLSYSVALGKNYIPKEKENNPTVENIEITKDKLTVVVHDEDTKKGIKDAVVTVNNTTYHTSADGIALINASEEKVRTEITVTADGYEDSTAIGEVSNGMILHILMIPKSDNLRITKAIADMDGQKYDLLREKIVLGYYSDLNKLSNRQTGSFSFTVKTNHNATLYELLSEDGTVAMQNTSGTFSIPTAKGGNTADGGTIKANMPLESALQQGKYQLRVTDGSGHTTTVGIGLTCTVNYLTAEREKISGKFSLGNAFEVQIADDVPLIGGGTFKFGLEDKLPVDISIDGNGMLKVAFNKPADVPFNKYKENYNNLAKKAKSASELASRFGKVEGFGAGYFAIDGSICGYGEGNISELDEGNITVKVGVIAILEGTGGAKRYFMAGFVPINIFVEGKASVGADFNVSVPIKNWKITGFDLTGGTMTGQAGLTVGAGVGIGIELNISLNGNINYTWKPARKYQKAWLEASGKVEEVLLFWSKTLWESPKYTYTIMEKGNAGRSAPEAGYNDTQEADFVPINRSYLDYTEGFLNTMSADTESTGISMQSVDGKTIVKTAIYPSASPVMTQVGDTSYLFWVEDIASRSANNIGAIVYSESQDNVTWSEPKRLLSEEEDNTFDGSFHVFTSGQKIYITWQDGTSVLEDSESMQQVLNSMSIRRAILDTQTGEVTVTDRLTKESGYYMYPCTVIQNGICYTAYIHNSLDSGDIYGNNTQNLYCMKEGTSNPETLNRPKNGIVVNMVSGIFDSKASVVCEIDTDGNLATSEDREIYLWDMASGSQTRLTDNATADSMPVISESGNIYWYQDGNIMRLRSKSESAQEIWPEQSLAAPVYFSVATGQDNRDIILWEMSDSEKPDGSVAVYGSRELDNGTWQNISKYAESQGTIASRLSAVEDWDHLLIARLEGVFLEDGTLLKDLCVLGREDIANISLDYVEYDEDQVHSGAALPIRAVITNHGNAIVDNVQFTVDGTAVQNTGSLNLQPGESREITVNGFTVPSDLNGMREFEISVVLMGDQNDADNTQSITLETTKYKIDTVTRLDRGGTWLDFTVWNEGDHPTSGVARVHKSTENGDIIYETDFRSLPSEHGYACSVDLSSYEDSVTHYYVEALPDYAEDDDSNDSEFVYIGYGTGVEEQIEADSETPVDSISLSDTETWLRAGESIQLTVTANTGTTLSDRELIWSSYDVSIASVDNDGNITAHRNGTTYITAVYGDLSVECAVHVGEISVKTYSISFDTQGGDSIKSITGLHTGDIVTLPENVNREGMIFLGWYTQAIGGEKIEDSTIVVQRSMILYAHWGEAESTDGFWITAVPDQIYTGSAIKPAVRVYDGKKLLECNKDYTISYTNNVKANDASNPKKAPTITIKGKGNYTSKETVTFKILPFELTADNTTVADMTKTYNHKMQQPIPSITVNGRKLKNKTDFTVTYPDNIPEAYQAVGTYRIVVTGKGNYSGEQTLTFDITDKTPISKASVTKIPNQAYTGSAVTPVPVVKYKKAALVEHVDYELEYQNNINIGKATIVFIGKGDYIGKKVVTFQITGGSLKKAKVTGLISPVIYTGEEIRQNCTLTMKVNGTDVILHSGKDYTVSYQNNIKAGTAKVTYKGINGYTGTLQKSYKITAYDILSDNDEHIEYTQDIVCAYLKGGSRPEPDIFFRNTLLQKGVDYTLSYKNNNAVGGTKAPMIIVKGKGSFKNKFEIPFTITPQNLSNMTLAPCDKVYKNGANIYKITPKLLDANGKALSAGKDFDKKSIIYTYGNDVTLENGTFKKAGDSVENTDIIPANTQICVTLTCGSGNLYEGTFTGIYRIVAADIKSAKVTIPVQTYTGSAITLDKTQIAVKLSKTELSSDDYDIVSYTNNIKKGKASVTIAGKGNYGGAKTVKFTIKAKGFMWWWR